MNVLGLVLARGGSKRVKRKNLRLLYGQPLLVWTIGQARHSHMLDRFVVSSEDWEILELARDYDTEVIIRPKELATDDCTSYPPMLHALNELDEVFDYLCLLQPTSPFRVARDIDGCILGAIQSENPAMVSFAKGADVSNGAIYVGRTDWLRDGGHFDGPAVDKYWMPIERSIDIDTEEDFAEAEAMIREWT